MTKAEQKIIKTGYKMTAPRLAVIEHLSSTHSPISARDLHQKIKTVDQASVYRALNLFEELQIVNVEMVNKEKLYCLADEPHHHIICRKCGHMESIICEHHFNQLKNFTNIYHQLTLTGVCNKCNQ
jgi:Fe2+ or Zn2+ uptake regulation protein